MSRLRPGAKPGDTALDDDSAYSRPLKCDPARPHFLPAMSGARFCTIRRCGRYRRTQDRRLIRFEKSFLELPVPHSECLAIFARSMLPARNVSGREDAALVAPGFDASGLSPQLRARATFSALPPQFQSRHFCRRQDSWAAARWTNLQIGPCRFFRAGRGQGSWTDSYARQRHSVATTETSIETRYVWNAARSSFSTPILWPLAMRVSIWQSVIDSPLTANRRSFASRAAFGRFKIVLPPATTRLLGGRLDHIRFVAGTGQKRDVGKFYEIVFQGPACPSSMKSAIHPALRFCRQPPIMDT